MNASKKTYIKPILEKATVALNLALNEEVKEWQAAGEEVFHLAFGQSPFPIPNCFVEALKSYAKCHEYVAVTGIKDLREAICNFYKVVGNVEYSADNIVIGCGSKELIFLAMQVFDGDVLLVSPGWTTYAPQVRLSGREPIIIDTTFDSKWKLTPNVLEDALKSNNNIISNGKSKLLIFNNPGNPSGASYSQEELSALAEVFRKYDTVVVSDEIYGFLNFDGSHVPLSQVYPERTLTTSGFSKWSSAGGWRVGYMFVPKEMPTMLEVLKAVGTQTFTCAPSPMQYALAKGLFCIDELKYYLHQERQILQLAANFCCSSLESVGVKCNLSDAGYYLFPDFEVCRKGFARRGITTCEQMCKAMLKEVKVALLQGAAFLRLQSEFTVRLCYVNFDGEKAMEGFAKQKELDDDFVKEFMPLLFEGIQRLVKFVQDHS